MTSSEAIRQDREETEENPIEAEIAARLGKIAERLKTQPHESLAVHGSDKVTQLIEAAQIPRLHASRKEFTSDEWQRVLDGIKPKIGTGCLFALVGVRGCGKTQLGCGLIKYNSTLLRSSRFTTAMEIFLDLKAAFRKDAVTTERFVVEEFCKPKLLVIDEIQERAESPWEDRILTHLINRRYNDEKDTILIGNITEKAFSGTMGASIASRLNETGGVIECNWKSFRESKTN